MTDYTPKVPTPDMVDKAVELLAIHWPIALERPDFVLGMLAALGGLGQRLYDTDVSPGQQAVVTAISQNVGDNFELYRTVRDTLFPAEDVDVEAAKP